jgi:hypothetical protein
LDLRQVFLLKIVKFGIIDPFTVEGHVRVNDSAITSWYENFLVSIRVEKHQIGTRLHLDRILDLRPIRINRIAIPGGADIHNVIVYPRRDIRRGTRG